MFLAHISRLDGKCFLIPCTPHTRARDLALHLKAEHGDEFDSTSFLSFVGGCEILSYNSLIQDFKGFEEEDVLLQVVVASGAHEEFRCIFPFPDPPVSQAEADTFFTLDKFEEQLSTESLHLSLLTEALSSHLLVIEDFRANAFDPNFLVLLMNVRYRQEEVGHLNLTQIHREIWRVVRQLVSTDSFWEETLRSNSMP